MPTELNERNASRKKKICFLEGSKRGFANRCIYLDNEFLSSSDEDQGKTQRLWWKTKQVTDSSWISRTNGMETRWGWVMCWIQGSALLPRAGEQAEQCKGQLQREASVEMDFREVMVILGCTVMVGESPAVSWDGKSLNSQHYSDRSRKTDVAQKGSSLPRLSLRWCSDYTSKEKERFCLLLTALKLSTKLWLKRSAPATCFLPHISQLLSTQHVRRSVLFGHLKCSLRILSDLSGKTAKTHVAIKGGAEECRNSQKILLPLKPHFSLSHLRACHGSPCKAGGCWQQERPRARQTWSKILQSTKKSPTALLLLWPNLLLPKGSHCCTLFAHRSGAGPVIRQHSPCTDTSWFLWKSIDCCWLP